MYFFRSTGVTANFESCLKTVRQYIERETKVQHVIDLQEYEISVFSYFYDRAVQANLLHDDNRVKVGDYKRAAEIGLYF